MQLPNFLKPPAILVWAVLSCAVGGALAREVLQKYPGQPARSHGKASADIPVTQYAIHDRGKIQLVVANNGTFGTLGGTEEDPVTGEQVQSCVYPKNSDLVFLYVSAVWIGGVVGRDTLVSCGDEDFYTTRELKPDPRPFGDFQRASIDIDDRFYSPDALSEQDLYCEYTDTITDLAFVESDPTDARPHRPMGFKVTQRSMAWSYEYADDFILFDYRVENISGRTLEDVYIGIYVDGDAWHTSRNGPEGWNDDLVGFYRSHPAPEGCGFIDTVNVAYHADADGDPEGGSWNDRSIRGVLGARVVRTPSPSLNYAFNWWITNYGDPTGDFGPRRQGTAEDPFRSFGSRLGTPEGDRNKYYVMRQQEFDYDLIYSALNQSGLGWLPPPRDAASFARGYDTRYLLSFGPFRISPGEELPISFAWVGGESLHDGATDYADFFNPSSPETFYRTLNFENLAVNSRWASWVYDNPGVDTDGDGYAGKFRTCATESTLVRVDTVVSGVDTTLVPVYDYTSVDTFFYEGDNIPDFRGAGPPPAPRVRIVPSVGKLLVRWNGFYSENSVDVFSRLKDFEGYRLYYGRDNRPGSLDARVSYDREDFNRYRLDISPGGQIEWTLEDPPFTIDSLRILYGDSFDPTDFTINAPLQFAGNSYYFSPQDFNRSVLGGANSVRKVYPDATNPGTDSTIWRPEDLTDFHGRPLPKFYEYEYELTDLLPTIPHYISVTCFDFGSPLAGLPALESDPSNGIISEYAIPPSDSVEASDAEVYVYPNPYRVDANYREFGYEGRGDQELPEDKVRLLHFANLPAKCTISIYSLDGDMVVTFEHDRIPTEPRSSIATWDLITRNRQAVVSGLYYYVVESETRTQIGTFTIVK